LTDELTQEEQEVLDRKTMDLAERKAADRATATYRAKARKEFVKQADIAANKDREYRELKATTYVQLRHEGETSEGSRIRAESASAQLRSERDIASSLAKAALLRVDEAERNSVSVRDVHATSQKIDGLAA
jgi:hypothetical protein